MGLDFSVLELDEAGEITAIAARMRELVLRDLHKRGVVVGVSGGVDSAVCAALAVRAFGPEKVLALLMPERESSSASLTLGRALAEQLGIQALVEEITPALEGLHAYQRRDEAIRSLYPAYGEGWRSKIVIAGGTAGGLNFFKLVVRTPAGAEEEQRLPPGPYLEIVAAQNYKQRVRKAVEYHHADRLNYAVIGTPNRLEYDQGFFVKNGDGAADVKPIAHLYKTQVYALARHFGLPAEICDGSPTTDTYTLAQGQDEFYFALPHQQMDLALWAFNHQLPAEELAVALSLTPERAALVYKDIQAKRATTRSLHARPLLVRSVPEVAQP
jgi:NAD+ synthase